MFDTKLEYINATLFFFLVIQPPLRHLYDCWKYCSVVSLSKPYPPLFFFLSLILFFAAPPPTDLSCFLAVQFMKYSLFSGPIPYKTLVMCVDFSALAAAP